MSSPVKLALILLIISALVYFGLDVSAPDLKQAGAAREKNLSATGIENIQSGAIGRLSEVQKAEWKELNLNLEAAKTDTARVEVMKRMSGFWYEAREYDMSGNYAEQVAQLAPQVEAWSIAGLTYYEGIKQIEDPKRKLFCYQSAEKCFIKAHDMDPSNPLHELHQAMCYVALPGDQPMKGILMLRDLETKHPDYYPIQTQLVKLAIQTNQLDRAKGRLDKILEKRPDLVEANCLMVEVLSQLGQRDQIEKYKFYCK